MPDNVPFQTTAATPASGTNVAADEATYSGDTAKVQIVRLVHVAGAEGAKTISEIADATNGLDVDVTRLPALVAGTANIGDVDVLTVPAPLSTTGGGVEATALRVTLASDSTGLVSVDDNGGSLTVDAASLPLPTGASTLAEQQVQTTALQLIDDAAHADDAVRGKSLLIGAVFDDTAPVAVTENQAGYVRMSSARRLLVDPSGVTSPISAASLPLPTGAATLAGQTQPGVDIGDVTVNNAAGASAVNVQDGGNSLTVDGTVTANAGTGSFIVVGAAAHDAAASGNPVMNAGSHETPADSAPTNRLATVTDGDVQRFSTVDGALYVIPSGPQQWKARLTGLIAADTTVKAAPGVGLSLYITDIVFSIGAATGSSIMLEESTTTPVFGPHYLEAAVGRGMAVHFGTPLKIAANTLLSATGTGSTTATLDVAGFTAPG